MLEPGIWTRTTTMKKTVTKNLVPLVQNKNNLNLKTRMLLKMRRRCHNNQTKIAIKIIDKIKGVMVTRIAIIEIDLVITTAIAMVNMEEVAKTAIIDKIKVTMRVDPKENSKDNTIESITNQITACITATIPSFSWK